MKHQSNIDLGLEDKFVIIVCYSSGLWNMNGDGNASSNLAPILPLFFL